jgi:hypothetical protein
MSVAIPPWHLWGGQEQLDLPANSGKVSRQLSKVHFDRPDTFTFMFFAFAGNINSVAAPADTIVVRFDVTLGIGRVSFTFPDMVSLLTKANDAQPAYTTSMFNHNVRTEAAGLVPDVQNILQVPAQDIQVQANIQTASLNALTCTVGCMFAPWSHVRDGWFQGLFSRLGGRR